MNQKVWVRTRIFCSFWIWTQKCCSRIVKWSLTTPKNQFGQSLLSEIFGEHMFLHFALLGSISDKPKPIGDDQNFVLFLNTDLEILYLFLSENSEESFWKAEQTNSLFKMANRRDFCSSYKYFSRRAKNFWSRPFCRANNCLQNVISN